VKEDFICQENLNDVVVHDSNLPKNNSGFLASPVTAMELTSSWNKAYILSKKI